MPVPVRVFVSHHHSPEEDAFTARLVADLKAAGADIWVDNGGITSDDFVRKISEGLAGRQWLVLVMTPASVQLPWVQREVNAALSEVTAGRMLGVLPLVMAECDVQNIPVLWRNLHRYDATQGYEMARDRLIQTLELKMPPARSAGFSRVVDCRGNGDHRTIQEAIDAASPDERILIRTGEYEEEIFIDKPVELTGDGQPGDVKIHTTNTTTTMLFDTTRGRLANLSIQWGVPQIPCHAF